MKVVSNWITKHSNKILAVVFILLLMSIGFNIKYAGNVFLTEMLDSIKQIFNKILLDKEESLNVPFLALVATILSLIWNVKSSNRNFLANQSTSIRKDSIDEVIKLSTEMIAMSNRSASIFGSLEDVNNTLKIVLKSDSIHAVGRDRDETIRMHSDSYTTYVNQLNENSKRAFEVASLISLILTEREEYKSFEKAAEDNAECIQSYQTEWQKIVNMTEPKTEDSTEKLKESSEKQLGVFINEAKLFMDKERKKLRSGI